MLSRHDAELVRRDPDVPGLGLLFDAEAFVVALNGRVPEMQAVRAAPHYVRYKPGTSCLIAYRIGTADGRTVDLYAKAYRRVDADKFEKAAEPRAEAGRATRGPFVLSDLLTLIRLHPDDGELDAMGCLADANERARLLARVLPNRPECWHGSLKRLTYKPERRFVAQVAAEDGNPQAVLKLYSAAGFERTSRNVKAYRSGEVLRMARRLGRSERFRAVALEWMTGDLLVDRLCAPEFDPADVRRVGHGLAELHGHKVKKWAPAQPRAEEAAGLIPIAEAVAKAYPGAAARIHAIAGRLGVWLSGRPVVERAIHGDFYSKQVLLRPDGTVAFLDLDEARRGDPAADLGNFIAHLERHALSGRIDPRRAAAVAEALRAGYAAAGREVDDHAVRMYTAVCLLYLAPQPFRDRQLGWPQHIDRILDRVESLEANGTPPTPHVGGVAWRASDVSVDPGTTAPHDDAMPYLRRAIDPAEVQRELDDGLVRPDTSGERFRLRAIRVTRHKPGRRCLIEYDVETSLGGDEPITWVGKVRAKGLDDSTYTLNLALRQSGFGDDAPDGVSVPEPVGTIRSFQMWLQRKMSGISAMNLLASPSGSAIGSRMAEVAMKLHRTSGPTRRRHTIADELRILRERLTSLVQIRPAWGQRLERLMDASDRLASEVSESAACGVHRDYYPDNLLVDGERVYLLDLDLYCEGEPALDIGNCAAHVTEYALRTHGSPGALRECEEAILERFARERAPARRRSAEVFRTLTLVRHVQISTQFADRAPFTEQLLEVCEQQLGM